MNARHITNRVTVDEIDEDVRFQWQMLHSSVYGRLQIDRVIMPDFMPDKKAMQQELQRAAYRMEDNPHAYFSPANVKYSSHVNAVQAIKEGTPTGKKVPLRGWKWSTGYRWYHDIWKVNGSTYGVASTGRKDGKFWLSYVLFFKKKF